VASFTDPNSKKQDKWLFCYVLFGERRCPEEGDSGDSGDEQGSNG
jgi:hypothetical protein